MKLRRGNDLLEFIHINMCGMFKSSTRHSECYFVSFTNDFSRYEYIYLIKHMFTTFEVFKEFQKEFEKQLAKKINTPRSDMVEIT